MTTGGFYFDYSSTNSVLRGHSMLPEILLPPRRDGEVDAGSPGGDVSAEPAST